MKMILNFVSQYFKVFNSTKKSSCRKLQLQPHLKQFFAFNESNFYSRFHFVWRENFISSSSFLIVFLCIRTFVFHEAIFRTLFSNFVLSITALDKVLLINGLFFPGIHSIFFRRTRKIELTLSVQIF